MPTTFATEVSGPDRFSAVGSRPGRRTRFYTVMGVVALAIAAAGFGPAILHAAGRKAPPTPLVIAHGTIFTCWLLLFIAQTLLVGRGRFALHRGMGYVAAGVAVLMIGSGYVIAIAMARRGYDLSGDLRAEADPQGSLVFQLGDLLSFGVLVAAGIACRRRPEAHKRLMLLATTGSLMAAPLTHLLSHIPAARESAPAIVIPLALLFFAPAIHDRLSRGRIHPVSLWVGIALFVWANFRAAVVNPHPLWRHFTGWLVGQG